MSSERERAAGASAGGFIQKLPGKHAPPVGTPCPNSGTPLHGPWCYACGQAGEDFHRSIIRLAGEACEGLLHMDGRLWRTIPDLLFRPGRLTRSYLEGHRAPQIPPLRLFLVVLLGIFLVGGLNGGSKLGLVQTTTISGRKALIIGPTGSRPLDQMTAQQRAVLASKVPAKLASDGLDPAGAKWLHGRITRTLADPERFQLILEQWSEKFAFLMLPISALMLSVLFVFQRRFYLFDHTIFSLHSLSVMGLGIILAMALNPLVGDWSWLLLLAAPIHLFMHLRGVYGTSAIGTLTRMFLLFLGTTVAATFLVVGLIAVGLNGMGS